MTKTILILSLLLVSCGKNNDAGNIKSTDTPKPTEKQKSTEMQKPDRTPKSDETIIDAGKGMESIFGKDYKSWTPEDRDIEAAENILAFAFEDQKRPTINRLLNRKPEDYDKQIIGYIDANGDKIIWMNCLCKTQESSFKNWKTDLVFVKDGGNCFFNIKLNIAKNSYTDLIVNGNG